MRRRNDCGTCRFISTNKYICWREPASQERRATRFGEKIAKESFRPSLDFVPPVEWSRYIRLERERWSRFQTLLTLCPAYTVGVHPDLLFAPASNIPKGNAQTLASCRQDRQRKRRNN